MIADFGFMTLLFVPIILLAIWAGYKLGTRKTKVGPGSLRSDRTERTELTGTEQQKHRRNP